MNTSEVVWRDIVKVFVERKSNPNLSQIVEKYGYLAGLLSGNQVVSLDCAFHMCWSLERPSGFPAQL
jgi:hypothetical protein